MTHRPAVARAKPASAVLESSPRQALLLVPSDALRYCSLRQLRQPGFQARQARFGCREAGAHFIDDGGRSATGEVRVSELGLEAVDLSARLIALLFDACLLGA